jgi:hypothetical protein
MKSIIDTRAVDFNIAPARKILNRLAILWDGLAIRPTICVIFVHAVATTDP